MSQSLLAIADDDENDEDEPTLSYTHSEIQKMREPLVRLEDFAEFGNRGTPAGMLGSSNQATATVVGVCGEMLELDGAELELDEVGLSSVSTWTAPDPVAHPGPEPTAPGDGEGQGWGAPVVELAVASAEAGAVVNEFSSEEIGRVTGRRRKLVIAALLLGLLVVGAMLSLRRSPSEQPLADLPDDVRQVAPTDETPPEPETLVPTVVPDLPPSDEPEPKEKYSKRRGSSPWQSSACARKRAKAEEARDDRKWAKVESATRSRKCWSDYNAYRRLRMKALFEIEEWGKCVKLGQGSSNEQIKSLKADCHRRQVQRSMGSR